jgi:D-glycero-D-manno-heptose 1,7-bisphosphate phosphatase
MPTKKVVILDRDGVINVDSDAFIKSPYGRIDAVFFCPHTAEDHCECRKPKPGMLKMITERFEVDPEDTPVVGDAMRDLQAGASLGFRTHLVLTGKGRKTLEAGGLPDGTRVHDDLRAFALDFISNDKD